MYYGPYFPADEQAAAQAEIDAHGLRADPVVGRLEAPVLGLNVAFAWPLPAAFHGEYERLHAALAALDPGVYVYPYERTHVTVSTLVSFRRFPDPSPAQEAALAALLPGIAEALDAAARGVGEIAIDVGPPVLVRPAAFLPILNPGGEVRRIRERLRESLGGVPDLDLSMPAAVHSTVLRFRQAPADAQAFRERFHEIAAGVRFGPALVRELLVTTETRPYMAGGAIVHRTTLG
jgi:hypothetical protein